ncbi:MAG: hypothetical protein QOJ84_92 [Bradyrhizobium sp.]|jgi:hypothetical protein|nr:hypothetical protein [Bradyrhizobium sp.]
MRLTFQRVTVKHPQGKQPPDSYPGPEAERRFFDALKAGLSTSPKPLKDKPKIRKTAKKKVRS